VPAIFSEFNTSYDIFRQLPDGSKVWVCEVRSLQEAKVRLLALERNQPANYYVCDLLERQVLGAATPVRPELHPAPEEAVFFSSSAVIEARSNSRP
jgi:hypothetical protein